MPVRSTNNIVHEKRSSLQETGTRFGAVVGIMANPAKHWGRRGTEFSGGRLTGPIVTMCEIAIVCFVVGIVLAFPFPRISSIISLLASLLCTPFLPYLIAPGLFRAVFRGEYSVPLQSTFVWGRWSLAQAIAILIVVTTSVWRLFSFHRHEVERSAEP